MTIITLKVEKLNGLVIIYIYKFNFKIKKYKLKVENENTQLGENSSGTFTVKKKVENIEWTVGKKYKVLSFIKSFKIKETTRDFKLA